MKDLKGQTAVVTGGGSGIGLATAKILAGEGATVVVADVDVDRAQFAAKQIVDSGGSALSFVGDASSDADSRRLVEEVVDATGRIDILVCNVGIYPTALLDDVDLTLWERVMTTNVTSAFLSIRSVSPIMRNQKYGRIVVTSSVTGPLSAIAGLIPYGASKAALTGLVKGAAVELGGAGITVNAVLPGTVDTAGVDQSGGSRFLQAMTTSIPLGRPADPAEVGWAIRLFASREASYITGTELVVDGGQRLPEGGVLAPLEHTYLPADRPKSTPNPIATGDDNV